jgi:DNA replication protein DnaC
MSLNESLHCRAEALHLYGLLTHWHELADSTWIEPLLTWEETERARRSLERRLSSAHIGRFKPLADFDWNWPEHCDRLAITELMSLEFLKTAANAILVGASGLGKSTIA